MSNGNKDYLNCVVLEDEPLALNIVNTYVKKVPFLKLMASFRYPMKALAYLQSEPVDLLFLDINMPDLSGIQLLKSLSRIPDVIFTTAYSQYALESYDFDAVDYLLKPIEFDRFLKAANKAFDRSHKINTQAKEINLTLPTTSSYFFVKSGSKIYKVNFEDILYLESGKNYVGYITENKKILTTEKISELEVTLPSDQFIRVHKSYIISLRHIDILQKEFVMIHNKRIPIGRTYRDSFFKLIQKKSKA